MKAWARAIAGRFGWEVWRTRGGILLHPKPRPVRAVSPSASRPGKLHLGCGAVRLDGYTNIDIVRTTATDLVANMIELPMIANSSITEIRMEAVLEHLYRYERTSGLSEWMRILAPGGLLDIRYLPDFDIYARAYLDRTPVIDSSPISLHEVAGLTHGHPKAWNAQEQSHKDIFTKASIVEDLNAAGFEVIACDNVCYRDEKVALNINVLCRKPSGKRKRE